MRRIAFMLLATCWALAQSKLYPVGKIVAPVPGQKGCYIVKVNDGVQVKVKDLYFVEGLTPSPIELEVTAIEGDSVMVRTRDQRVMLPAQTEVGSKTALSMASGQGAGETGGTHRSKSASEERAPTAAEESVLARDRSRLKNSSIRDRYDDPVVTNSSVRPDDVYATGGVYAPGDVRGPMEDFNREHAPLAAETTDGLPSSDLRSPYNQTGPSGASGFEKPGKGSYDANLPATFVVEKAYFFFDNQRNICLRLKVRNKGGQAAPFQIAADCTNPSGRVVYSITKEFTRLEPGHYDYYNILTGLQPRQSMYAGGYVSTHSATTSVETESFGEVRARPRVQALTSPDR